MDFSEVHSESYECRDKSPDQLVIGRPHVMMFEQCLK
jgi:hypothetical protein